MLGSVPSRILPCFKASLRSPRLSSLTISTKNVSLLALRRNLSDMANSETKAAPSSCDNSGDRPLRVPGFGLPITWKPESENAWSRPRCFRHGADDFRPERMTIREVAMIQFMDAITDKPDWHRKVFDEGITEKWRAEAAEADDGDQMSDKTFDWCIAELRDRASAFEEDGLVRTLECGARVIKSDAIVTSALREELRDAVKPLLEVEDGRKDWHPNSNEQVLNLVHPSLYPLVYGRTRVLETGRVGLLNCMDSTGTGIVARTGQEIPSDPQESWRRPNLAPTFWSTRFQWLPSEVKFAGASGTNVELTSYINNLHPVAHHRLYRIVEKLISIAIPTWNEVLIEGYEGRNRVRIPALAPEIHPSGYPDWTYKWDKDNVGSPENQEIMEKLREYLRQEDNPDREPDSDDEDVSLPDNWETAPMNEWEPPSRDRFYYGWSVASLVEWKHKRIRRIACPEPGEDRTYEQWAKGSADSKIGAHATRDPYKVKLEERFRQQGLQVIVKLASVELTPDKPEYPGGGWHIEGMLNEHIVATAIYYYDVENCTESRLSFRQEADLDELDLQYEQDDHGPLAYIYGTESMRDEPAVQDVGSVDTRGGRLLAFPNTLQHKVEPFRLADPGRPGHRRFLVLWLVDPNFRVASTANVPPQQEDWWAEHVRVDEWGRELPQEIKDHIVHYAKEDMMRLEETKELRLKLMEERTTFADGVEQAFQTYNLCEH